MLPFFMFLLTVLAVTIFLLFNRTILNINYHLFNISYQSYGPFIKTEAFVMIMCSHRENKENKDVF